MKFQNRKGEEEYAYQTSWGSTTRLIGAIIMAHGDNRGLKLPPKVAPIQVVIVPIAMHKEGVRERANELYKELKHNYRTKLDDREQYSPGYKFNDWEMRGVPIRIELGPKDIQANKCIVVRRDDQEKIEVPLNNINEKLNEFNEYIKFRKVAVIGCGFVGSASAFALMQSGMFSEMVLIDADHDKAEGEALDISHGTPFARPMKIYAGGYDDIVDASIIVITAGANQKPGETRLDLVKKNIGIFKTIIPEIKKRDCKGILLIVANPVDILTYTAVKLSGFPENRVIGSGTVLDTARLKEALGSHLQVDSRSVHAFIIGEHGDSEIAAWSSANVSGIDLNDFCEMRGHYNHHEAMEKIANDVKNSAYEIIAKKHATYYGIAMSVKRICEAIVRDEKSIMPISSMMHGEYGIEDVALSMPAIVGKNGAQGKVPISLNYDEITKLQESA